MVSSPSFNLIDNNSVNMWCTIGTNLSHIMHKTKVKRHTPFTAYGCTSNGGGAITCIWERVVVTDLEAIFKIAVQDALCSKRERNLVLKDGAAAKYWNLISTLKI